MKTRFAPSTVGEDHPQTRRQVFAEAPEPSPSSRRLSAFRSHIRTKRKKPRRFHRLPESMLLATPQEVAHLVLHKVLHARYAWGASLETGPATDCSGFTQFIYRICGIDLPHSSAEQAQMGRLVTRRMDFSKLHPGDLLFFRQGGRAVGHVGLYLGEGKMMHASDYRNGVIVSDLRQPYFERTFVVAKRVFESRRRPVLAGLIRRAKTRMGKPGAQPPPPVPRLLPPPLTRFLLKAFWPWEYHLPLDFG